MQSFTVSHVEGVVAKGWRLRQGERLRLNCRAACRSPNGGIRLAYDNRRYLLAGRLLDEITTTVSIFEDVGEVMPHDEWRGNRKSVSIGKLRC